MRNAGIEIGDRSNPKRTDTTQRWKIGLAVPGHRDPIRTKIEFSYREGDGAHRVEPIPRHIVEPYALRSPLVPHYVDKAPTEQKVLALAGRSETQARDVFDLDLLLRREPLASGDIDPTTLTTALDRAMQLPYAAFRDQVLPFREPDAVELYEGEAAWEQMQTFVAERLEEAR